MLGRETSRSLRIELYPKGWTASLAVVALGVAIAIVVVVFPQQLTIFVIVGMSVFVPALVVKDPKRYWIGVFLLFSLLGKGKSLTKDYLHPAWIRDNLGFPPGHVTITVLPSDVVFFILLVLWILRVATREERVYFPKIGYVGLAYLAWATISSLLNAVSPYLSLVELVQQYKYFLMFLYFSNAVDSKKLVRTITSLLIACLLIEVAVILVGWEFRPVGKILSALSLAPIGEDLPLVYEEGESEVKRAIGTLGVQGTAFYLHFLIPLALARFLMTENTGQRLTYLLLFILGVAALYVLFSRSALVALAGVPVCVYFLAYRRGFVSKTHIFRALVAAGVILFVMMPEIQRYMESRRGSVALRYALLRQGSRMVESHPVLGVGLNNSTVVKRQMQQEYGYEWSNPIHSHYVVLAAEVGIVGFILFGSFFVLIAVDFLRCSKSADRDIAGFGISAFGTYTAVAIHILGDPIGAANMLWLYAGLIEAFRKMEGRRLEAA